MSQQLTNGKEQFLNGSGVPLAGGSVAFYSPGTLDPVNTYQDPGLTTLNANPVVLDANGMATIWGTSNAQYRQIVKDALGNTIWDEVVGLTATSTQWLTGGSASSTAGGTPVSPPISGTPVQIPIQSVLANVWGCTFGRLGSASYSGAGMPGFGNTFLDGAEGTISTSGVLNYSSPAACAPRLITTEPSTVAQSPLGFYTGAPPPTVSPFNLSSSANEGGFYLEIYGGIDSTYDSTSRPSYFFGVCAQAAAAPSIALPFLTDNTYGENLLGIISDPHSTGDENWYLVARNGTNVATVTALNIPVEANQFFAVQINYPPGSNDAGTISVSMLTAPGVWTPVLVGYSLSGVGPSAASTAGLGLFPGIFAKNAIAGSGTTNSIFMHRVFGIPSAQYSVGSAFGN